MKTIKQILSQRNILVQLLATDKIHKTYKLTNKQIKAIEFSILQFDLMVDKLENN